MVKLPGGFSPVNAFKEATTKVPGSPTRGRDYDVFSDYSVRGGDRSPANGAIIGPQVQGASTSSPSRPAPSLPTQGAASGGGGVSAAQAAYNAQLARENAERGGLRGDIGNLATMIMQAYDALFGSLDTLLKDRSAGVERDYGEQFGKASKQYADSLPLIEQSYAALGAADSTDLRDANISAKEGFDETNRQIGKNKESDLAKIGQYGAEQRAKWGADRDSVSRVAGRRDSVEDLGELRTARNDMESKLGSVRADAGTLNTDAGARGQLSKLTQDGGRFEAITNALDSIIKGSMSGDVKSAAVKSVMDSSGLSEEDKQKVQTMYGNTYAEQAQL